MKCFLCAWSTTWFKSSQNHSYEAGIINPVLHTRKWIQRKNSNLFVSKVQALSCYTFPLKWGLHLAIRRDVPGILQVSGKTAELYPTVSVNLKKNYITHTDLLWSKLQNSWKFSKSKHTTLNKSPLPVAFGWYLTTTLHQTMPVNPPQTAALPST